MNVSRAQILDVLEHFKSTPVVTNEALMEYCNLKGYGSISEGEYADFRFANGHDERMSALTPQILKALSEYVYIPDLASEEERTALVEKNELIAIEICRLMEEGGVLYQEIDVVTETLGSTLKAVLSDAGKRANNMCATMLGHTARQKYGDPLMLKVLGEAYRDIAKEEGKKAGL